MSLPLAAFMQLAASCGPTVHVDTLAAIARTESGFDVLAIHDNAERRSVRARSREEATALAASLIAKHRSVDLGLMQINSANLPRLGMSVADAFDACQSIAAAARVLADGWRPAAGEDAQAALLRALSHYNTGHPARGFANGYVRRVQASAEQIVPALRTGGTALAMRPAEPGVPAAAPAAAPPAWDVYAQARHARSNGASAGRAKPAAPAAPPKTAAPDTPRELAAPVQLQAAAPTPSETRR